MSAHLLGRRDALLLVELHSLLGLHLQAQALLKGLVLQHERGPQPEVVRLAQVLQDAGPDGDRGHALGHGFHKTVQRTGLTVALHLVAAAAQERADLACQRLEPQSTRIQGSAHKPPGTSLSRCLWGASGNSLLDRRHRISL